MDILNPQEPVNEVIHSDALHGLWELLSLFPGIEQAFGGKIATVLLVVDANYVLADLRWLTCKRKNPNARTHLMEAVAAGTLLAVGPPELETQVEYNLSKKANEWGVKEEELRKEWQAYQLFLRFHDVPSQFRHYIPSDRDPSDRPYIDLQEILGFPPIVTSDPDIESMGGITVTRTVTLNLRNYARAKSVEVTVIVGGLAVIGVSITTLVGIGKLLLAVGRAIQGLPPWLRWALWALTAIALLHQGTRERILRGGKTLVAGLKELGEALRPGLESWSELLLPAMEEASRSLAAIETATPTAVNPNLLSAVVSTCAKSRRPLTVAEIERRVRLVGIKAKRGDLQIAIRKVLGTKHLFARTKRGFRLKHIR